MAGAYTWFITFVAVILLVILVRVMIVGIRRVRETEGLRLRLLMHRVALEIYAYRVDNGHFPTVEEYNNNIFLRRKLHLAVRAWPEDQELREGALYYVLRGPQGHHVPEVRALDPVSGEMIRM